MSQENLIRQQAETIVILNKRVANLEREKAILKGALRRDLVTQRVSYQEKKDTFSRLEQPILEAIIDLARKFEGPVSYERIVKGVKIKLPFPIKDTTIRRTVRKLRESGHLIKHGVDEFYPNIGEKNEVQT